MLTRMQRNALWLFASIVVAVGLYAVVGFFGAPRLLRSQAQEFISDKYARQLNIGTVRFNPFTLCLEVHDVMLPDADGAPMLAFGRLFANLDVSSVWRRGASFHAIELDRPFVRTLVRADGRLNLVDLTQPFAASKPASPDEPPTRVFIDRVRVSAGHVDFEDRQHASPFHAQVRPITFELRDFSTAGTSGNAYGLEGQSVAGERFQWNGTFALQPLSSRGSFTFSNLQARTLWNYLRDSLHFEIPSGIVNVAGDYDLASTQAAFQLRSRVQSVNVANLAIRPKGGTTDYVSIDSLQIDDTHLDLAARRFTIGKVRVATGHVRAWRDESGHINLLELSAPSVQTETVQTNTAVQENTAKSPAWNVSAPNIIVEGLKVSLDDRQTNPAAAFTLDPVNVHVRGFSNAPGGQLDMTLEMNINGSGTLEATGHVTPDSDELTAHVELGRIELTALQPYIDQLTQVKLLSGTLAASLDLDRSAAGDMVIKGGTTVEKLRTVDSALQKDFIKWDLLRAENIHYASGPARLQIGTITTVAPYARVIIAPDQTLNLTQILSSKPASSPSDSKPIEIAASNNGAATSSPQRPLSATIGKVQIAKGSATFADFWIRPNYAVSIQDLNGTITGLSSDPSSRAKVQLKGKVDRYAPAQIDGEINLLSASLYSDIKMSFKGVDMTSVTPYSGRFAGYRIEKGKLSVDLAYHVENRQLNAEQRFVIDQLQLGEKVESADAVNLPLKLAVALLKDRNGVIDIGLPVSGSLDDPKFRLGPIIWKAFVGLLSKIATAPFAMLGRLFGGSEEMNLIDFEPGDAALDAAAEERLASVLKALQDRPQLQLDVPMAFAPDTDGPALATQRLNAKLLALAQQAAEKHKRGTPIDAAALDDPARRFELLVAQYRLDYGKQTPLPPIALAMGAARKKDEAPDFAFANTDLEAALNAKHPITPADLEALGASRAQAVQEALLGGGTIDPARVFVIAARPQTGPADAVRLEMSLK
ncbi:MAG: DUF748 domain-containing protein [Steroidobacteraceae bacterium]